MLAKRATTTVPTLRSALAKLDATRAKTSPVAALRAWREAAARRHVRRLSERKR